MKYLIRREYVTTGYEYSMPLTKEILQSLQEYINEHVEPEFIVTEEMAIKAFTYSYNMFDDKEVLDTKCRYKDGTASCNLTFGDVIADYLLDLIWEEDPEEIYCETDEAYNEVNDSKDFD
jgi:hypothetical protein